ncbi:hypothetical protein GCM10011519_30890 [Marmoricola endophyticus]|uniref:Uncharacterized protein n=1 Tax=Marmoricola endophyticus TaxID=2040280 RepID=A0A917BSJ5_9ACTN|nr:hypothetical protein [Marmoricola endophyticus]GGF54786.1 hypothetical protein GCM10011519_30890 [Marmoricola endophyticus]
MPAYGVHLTRRAARTTRLPGLPDPVGLAGVLDGLDRRLTPADAPGAAPARAWTWEGEDASTASWYPQGVTTSADASPSGRVAGREIVMTSWYSTRKGEHNQGSRISVLDVEAERYQHVLVVRPTKDGPRPLRIHAGGLLWYGPHVHLAATRRGLYTAHLDDVVEVEPRTETAGHRFVLPVRYAYDAQTAEGTEPLRYSFCSVDREADPPELLVGEYGTGAQTTRIAHWPLDPETGLLAGGEEDTVAPLSLDERGVGHMQGVAKVGGRYYATVSRGTRKRGRVYVGVPGRMRPYRWALPPGPEDISYWPQRDELWTLTEHPGQRYVVAMERARLRRFPWPWRHR